jgi:uncharacterized protein (DUF1778 family)
VLNDVRNCLDRRRVDNVYTTRYSWDIDVSTWASLREQTMAATSTAARTRTINIRIEEERRTLIDRAAEAAGKDRTQFVLDAATREATTVLLDQRYFQLDTDAFAKFNAALDASPAENPRLRALLSGKAPWER